jgi:hypothetical protein
MSLPVSGLSDLELIRYAPIDDSAKEELARRLGTSSGLELYDEFKSMEAQISEYQRKEDAASSCSCNSGGHDPDDLLDCIGRVRDLLKDHKTMDLEKLSKAVEDALKEMDDFH